MIGKRDIYRRALRALGIIAAMMISVRASAQETAVTRIDLPIGRAYPYRANEVITRVTVANPTMADAVVVSEREIVINAVNAGEGDIIIWLQSGARVHFRVQVHTHPLEAFHSPTDDEFPIIHKPGFLSLVIPNFGLGPVGFEDAYLTEIQGDGGWREVAIPSRLVLA